MLEEDAKVGILNWLFGKKPLDKAAQQGQTNLPVKPVSPVQNNDYVKQQIDKMEQEKQKVNKEALNKLKKVK